MHRSRPGAWLAPDTGASCPASTPAYRVVLTTAAGAALPLPACPRPGGALGRRGFPHPACVGALVTRAPARRSRGLRGPAAPGEAGARPSPHLPRAAGRPGG